MGTLIQRRPFENPAIARATADWFHEPRFAIRGIEILTDIVEQDGKIWLVLTQQGEIVINANGMLPGYEMVSFQP